MAGVRQIIQARRGRRRRPKGRTATRSWASRPGPWNNPKIRPTKDRTGDHYPSTPPENPGRQRRMDRGGHCGHQRGPAHLEAARRTADDPGKPGLLAADGRGAAGHRPACRHGRRTGSLPAGRGHRPAPDPSAGPAFAQRRIGIRRAVHRGRHAAGLPRHRGRRLHRGDGGGTRVDQVPRAGAARQPCGGVLERIPGNRHPGGPAGQRLLAAGRQLAVAVVDDGRGQPAAHPAGPALCPGRPRGGHRRCTNGNGPHRHHGAVGPGVDRRHRLWLLHDPVDGGGRIPAHRLRAKRDHRGRAPACSRGWSAA